jgi:hypothetical protein
MVNIGIDAEKHGIDIADVLKDLGVPFGFITGYPHSLAERHAGRASSREAVQSKTNARLSGETVFRAF